MSEGSSQGRAAPRRVVAWDTETSLIRPACLAPELVCVTYQSPGSEAEIVHHTDAEPLILSWLDDESVLLVGHNGAYDLAVVAERFPHLRPYIFQAYEAGRVTDTQIRQQLLDNAAGRLGHFYDKKGKRVELRYTLEALADRCAGMRLQKDAWRTSYDKFINTPISRWPEKAREVQASAATRIGLLREEIAATKKSDKTRLKALQTELNGLVEMCESSPEQCLKYPLDDARATLAVYLAQERHAEFLKDQFRQARAAWALHLQSAWGLRTDEHGVTVLRRETEAELEEIEAELKEAGLVKKDGVRDTKAAKALMIAVCKEQGRPFPRTESHDQCLQAEEDGGPEAALCEEHICLDAEACEDSEHPLLEKYAKLSTLKKVLSNDVAALEKGVEYPVHTRYGFAASGRTTSSKPNIQNASKRPGIREAFVPRPGHLFFECDYPQLELFTLAQCCVSWVGFSKLGETLLAGNDPHLMVAASILRMQYDEAKKALKDPAHPKHALVKKTRQLAKPANFGFPGGLGAESFVAFAKGSMKREDFLALELTIERAKELKIQWLEAWPEMAPYFARVNRLCEEGGGRAMAETLHTQRWRGNATYCAACNNGFQALGSDCAKNAAWLIAKAQYDEPESPLYNTRTVAFVHDEFIGEVEEGPRADPAARELARLMVKGANEYLPDVPIALERMEPLLMRRWSKNATATYDDKGTLIPWAA